MHSDTRRKPVALCLWSEKPSRSDPVTCTIDRHLLIINISHSIFTNTAIINVSTSVCGRSSCSAIHRNSSLCDSSDYRVSERFHEYWKLTLVNQHTPTHLTLSKDPLLWTDFLQQINVLKYQRHDVIDMLWNNTKTDHVLFLALSWQNSINWHSQQMPY